MSKASINTDLKDYGLSYSDFRPGIWKYSPLDNIVICSKCNYEHYLGTYHQYATKYCPNCGSKMKEVY